METTNSTWLACGARSVTHWCWESLVSQSGTCRILSLISFREGWSTSKIICQFYVRCHWTGSVFNRQVFLVSQIDRAYGTRDSGKWLAPCRCKYSIRTGIFFWAMATTQSVPRIATVVRPPWLIALKAYSRRQARVCRMICGRTIKALTNLIESSFWRKDSDVSIETCRSCATHSGLESRIFSI